VYHFKIGKQLLLRRFPPATTHHLAKLSFMLGISFILWAFVSNTVNTNQI